MQLYYVSTQIWGTFCLLFIHIEVHTQNEAYRSRF
jgi:hypothetical protein